MKGRKIFLVVFVVLVILLAGVFFTIKSIDFNQYKDLIAQQVKDATGRELTMVGDLDFEISLTPDLIVNDARFANASWGTRPEMITVDRLEIEVALIPLLSGDIQIMHFKLIEPDILLETNADGQPNWQFDIAPKEPPQEPSEQQQAGATTLDLHALSIEKAHLAYRDGHSGKTSTYEIMHLVVQEKDPDTDTIDLEATYDGNPVSVKGTIGTVFNLLQNKPYPVDLNINAVKAELWVKGHFERPLEGKGANLAVSAKIPNLSNLSQFTAAEIPDIGPLELNAKFMDEDEIHHIDELEARLGNIELSGNGQVSAGDQPTIRNFNIALKVPDMSSVSKLVGTELPSIDPIKASSIISFKDNTVKFSKLKANMGEVNVSGQGTLDLAGDTPRVSGLTLALNAANLSSFAALAGTDLPSTGPLKVSARVTESKDAYNITKINTKLGNSDLRGNVSVATKGKRPTITANLTSTALDITALTPQENAENKKTKGKPQQKTKQKQQLFSHEPLPLEALKFANADVKIKAKKVVTKPRTYMDVDVALKLKDGKLDIKRVQAKFAGGSLALDGSIDAATPTAQIGMNVSAKRIHMEQLDAFKDLVKGSKIDMAMKVSGTGKSIQQIMAGLNGNVLVKADKGQLLYENTDLLGEDLLMRLIRTINPAAKEVKRDQLHCGVVNLHINDGMVAFDRGLALENDRMTIVGSGLVDLKNEEMDIGIRPEERQGVGINVGQLAKLVRVTGKLSDPKLAADYKELAKTYLTVSAAVATGGLSYLAQSLHSSATKDKTPCLTALGQKPKEVKAAEATSESKSAETEKTTEKDEGTAKKLFKDIKGIFGGKSDK